MISKRTLKHLEEELKRCVEGEVRFDAGTKALYATDASNYRQVPYGVVLPKSKEDIVQTVRICRAHQAPLLSRGCGTSLAGQCCNTAVIMDMSKYMNRIIKLDPGEKYAIVEPGVVRDQLDKEAKKYQLTFGPDTSTHAYATLGGMIGNNSCGTHSVMAGRTDDNVLELEILTYDGVHMTVGETSHEMLKRVLREGGRKGEIYSKLNELALKYGDLIEARYPKIPRRISGYNLPWLLEKNGFHVARALVGSESTCITILSAKVRLVYDPPAKSLLVIGYPDVFAAGDDVPEIMAHGPTSLEGIDSILVNHMILKKIHPKDTKYLPEGKGWLLVEFGGESKKEADAKAHKLIARLKARPQPPSTLLYDNKEKEEKVMEVRESGLGATARVPTEKDTWEGWEDSAVPPDHLGDYLRDLRKLFDKYGYNCALYGHFGQGCVHTRIDFDLYTHDGIKKYRSFINEAADLVISHGGSFSGEHGDGQSRADLLPKMFGPELMQAFREFKSIWDPEWKMNPGKKIDAYKPTDNMRLGPQYRQKKVFTHFKFPGDDEGSFARATLRCVGVGKCRRDEKGTMCPSYMVTKEEMHSTRGRAHLLYEMLQGQVIGKNGWRDAAVKEALDLCLSCKGCKTECPMNVDMSTYKAEFLSHYYKGRIRPRSAYAFGLIFLWARFATRLPRLSNFFSNTSLGKWLVNAPPERTIPKFAVHNFKEWFFRRREQVNRGKFRVILWPDTFNNYFHPDVAKAATLSLEKLGFEVVVPKVFLCCGRPLYDYGMLKMAKKNLQKILHALKDEITNGTPLIGLEPSCVSVFRDELGNLFPSDINAKRLAENTFMLSEFFDAYLKEFLFPPLYKKALIHGHCHHKTVIKFDKEKELLKKLGLDYTILDSGCCGMAGSFGFEKDHYAVSVKAGERILMPEVRKADKDTLLITNGFSCREQIEQLTGRRAYHIAEVIWMALEQEPEQQLQSKVHELLEIAST